ncbi:hypothetical protein Ciccas_012502 [Cichlidogyrus casuarinus]|uniref:Uncharacterized protein n=1 Tax=Cichlidogyrus casuarinus TaxID=1844966 RepID=A0ABD2PN72_9PLAT
MKQPKAMSVKQKSKLDPERDQLAMLAELLWNPSKKTKVKIINQKTEKKLPLVTNTSNPSERSKTIGIRNWLDGKPMHELHAGSTK